jgi:hypothetical protein
MWRPNPSWKRLHVAELLSRPIRHPDDAANVLNLIRAGWRAGGYHLHLELLEAAHFACHVLPQEDREEHDPVRVLAGPRRRPLHRPPKPAHVRADPGVEHQE